MVVTISKYSNALPPTLPTFFKLPIPLMPNEMVRKMMGLINILTTLIKIPLSNSLKVAPTVNSSPAKFTFQGCFKTGYKAIPGAKCPMRIPAVIASNTQKVRLVNNFFINKMNIQFVLSGINKRSLFSILHQNIHY